MIEEREIRLFLSILHDGDKAAIVVISHQYRSFVYDILRGLGWSIHKHRGAATLGKTTVLIYTDIDRMRGLSLDAVLVPHYNARDIDVARSVVADVDGIVVTVNDLIELERARENGVDWRPNHTPEDYYAG